MTGSAPDGPTAARMVLDPAAEDGMGRDSRPEAAESGAEPGTERDPALGVEPGSAPAAPVAEEPPDDPGSPGRGRWRLAALAGGAVVAGAGAWFALSGSPEPERADSRIEARNLLAPDPAAPLTPQYERTIAARDAQRLDEALETSRSFLPESRGPGLAETQVEDPLAPGLRLRPTPGEGEGRLANGGAQAAASVVISRLEAAVTAPDPLPDPLLIAGDPADAGSRDRERRDPPARDLTGFIASLAESRTRAPSFVRQQRGRSAADETARAEPAPANAPAAIPAPPLVPAGGDLYARLRYGVTSDLAAPVVAEVLEPPLRGAVATGGFEAVGTDLALRFTRLDHQGAAYEIDAWGVAPDSADLVLPAEIDRHWFARLLAPAAIAFAAGYLQAAAVPATRATIGATTVIEEAAAGTRQRLYAGGAEAVAEAGQIFAADAPKRSTLRLPAGTELALTFLRPVQPVQPETR